MIILIPDSRLGCHWSRNKQTAASQTGHGKEIQIGPGPPLPQTTGPRARWSPVRGIFKKTPGQCFPPGGPVVCGWPQGDATRASWAATRLLGVGPGRTDELLDIGFVSGDSAGRGVGRGHTRHGVRQTPLREMFLQIL